MPERWCLVSTENKRSKIMNATSIWKDVVSKKLNSNEFNSQFYYHKNNES